MRPSSKSGWTRHGWLSIFMVVLLRWRVDLNSGGECFRLLRARIGARLQAMQKIRCALRVGGCREDGAFVLFRDGQPVTQIGGVVLADFRGNAEVGAKERGSQFRNEFFPCV